MEEELIILENKIKENDSIELKEELIKALDDACDKYEKEKPQAFFGMCIRKKELAQSIYETKEEDDYKYLLSRTIIDVAICLLNQDKIEEAEKEIKQAYDLLIGNNEEESYFDNQTSIDNDFLSLVIDCCDVYGNILETQDKLVPAFNIYMKKYVIELDYQENNEEDIIDEINKTITTELLPLLEQIENYEFSLDICEAYFDFNEKNYSKKDEEFKYVIDYYKKCCKLLSKKDLLSSIKKRF